ncbi:MAG: SPOR domain-containing protein, partial [Zetaproteobacteria bacterium CG_4_9_14_3_um_filter_53_7]
MSENNSGNGKQVQSVEQLDGDPGVYLDALIAQFQGDGDVDFPKHTDRPQSSADAQAGLIESDISGPDEPSSDDLPELTEP